MRNRLADRPRESSFLELWRGKMTEVANRLEKMWVGFDLGGTKMLAGVYDHRLELRGQKRRRTRGHEGVRPGLKRIVQTIEQALEEAQATREQLVGIAMGCPGPVDPRRGVVREMVNLGWSNVPLRDVLQEEFHCPVTVLNDVDAGVYGEYTMGAGRGGHTVLGVFPGTGIGGGCVTGGRIVTGQGLTCMEIGHVQIEANGELCGCGHRGCLETRASRLAIAASCAQAAFRGEAPYLAEQVGSDLAEIRSGVLAKAIENGDIAVEHIVRRAASLLGIAIANVIHLLCPDVIVLGGGMVEALPGLWMDEVSRSARERVMKPYRDAFRVVQAELGDNAAVLGAAAWARDQSLPNAVVASTS